METRTFEQAHKPFVPWNKGKVTGQEPPLKPREVWAIRVGFRSQITFATWRSSTLRSTASCNTCGARGELLEVVRERGQMGASHILRSAKSVTIRNWPSRDTPRLMAAAPSASSTTAVMFSKRLPAKSSDANTSR